MIDDFQGNVLRSGPERSRDGSRLAGRAAIELYFDMIHRRNDALKSQAAKLAIALERHRAILLEAERSAK